MSLIRDSLTLIEQVAAQNVTQVLVGLSGGKDSITVLDLCVKVFGQESVFPFYLYWLKGLECEQTNLDRILKRYPLLPPLEYIPHYGLTDIFRTSHGRGRSRVIEIEFESKSVYTLNDTERIARYRTRARWIAYGHRMVDSSQRRGMLNKCQGIWYVNSKGKPVQRFYPIFKWKAADVFSYLKANHLPIPDMFGADYINSNGVNLFSPAWLLHLQQHWPRDYQRIKQLFPLIDTQIFRDQVRAKYSIDHQSEKFFPLKEIE